MYDPFNVYRGRYKEFIESIMRERPLNERLEYCHEHHIIPKCIFKNHHSDWMESKENKIYLTHREHFISHKILAEDNPHIKGLQYAYWRMCNGRWNDCTPEEYESARIAQSKAMEGNDYCKGPTPDTGKKISKSLRGYKQEESHTSKIAASNRGKKRSIEVRQKMSATRKGVSLSEKHKRHISESKIGKKRPAIVYHFNCISCGEYSLGRSPTQKYCDKCKLK